MLSVLERLLRHILSTLLQCMCRQVPTKTAVMSFSIYLFFESSLFLFFLNHVDLQCSRGSDLEIYKYRQSALEGELMASVCVRRRSHPCRM